MKNAQYDLLMEEMDKIAETVKLFPDSVQESVFTLLTGALTESERSTSDPDGLARVDPTVDERSSMSDQLPNNESEFIAMIKGHVSDHRLDAITHAEFATYGTYVYVHLAPLELQADEIGKAELENVYQIAGRKPPAKPSNQFNAAKNSLKYLANGSARGTFKLTAQGRYYVEHDLLGSDEK